MDPVDQMWQEWYKYVEVEIIVVHLIVVSNIYIYISLLPLLSKILKLIV